MHIEWKSAGSFAALVMLPLFSGACQPGPGDDGSTGSTTQAVGSSGGAASKMPAYYDDELFTVNMTELPDNASAALLAHNKSINMIFATNDLDEEQDFIPVLDAIQGDGFNPLWQQILYSFNAAPHQITSDTDIFAAAASGEITLHPTDEIYRCAVVGPK